MQVPDYAAFANAVAENNPQPEAAFNALWQLTRDIGWREAVHRHDA